MILRGCTTQSDGFIQFLKFLYAAAQYMKSGRTVAREILHCFPHGPIFVSAEQLCALASTGHNQKCNVSRVIT